MSKVTNCVLSMGFGGVWYALSMWLVDPILARIYQTYADDFPMRFAALSLYVLATLAAANCYTCFVWGVRSLLRKKSK